MSLPDLGPNPWDWLQPQDLERFGTVLLDPKERARWCKATLIGGLPYLWRRKAAPFLDFTIGRMRLAPGEHVFLLGESIASCGFEEHIRAAIGPSGTIEAIDIQERARTSTAGGVRGRGGRLGTWRYDYTEALPASSVDCVAVLQAVQHCDDWPETARDIVRVLKPGGRVVLAEIGLGPQIRQAASLDLHLEYWMDKLHAAVGMTGPESVSYYPASELLEAFTGLVEDAGEFTWRGADLAWGTKPVA